jgi:hypothetical protein
LPIPKKRKDESADDFMERCMSDETMTTEFPDEEQRSAICYARSRAEANSNKEKKGDKNE